jgi:hypothetical protein
MTQLFLNSTKSKRMRSTTETVILIAISMLWLVMPASGQENPYQVIYHWGELPNGRTMGIVTGVQPDPDGEHIWIIERCGANQCAGSAQHPHP